MADNAENEEKLFSECPVCMELYSADDPARIPKLLLCAHTFCVTCLDGLLMHGSVVCPTCRSRTIVAKGVAGLHNNFALIDVLSSVYMSKPVNEQCPQCNKMNVTMYCPQCDGQMCDSCSTSIHSIVFFKSHTPMPGNKHTAEMAQQKCEKHDEVLKLFCEKEQIPICTLCNLFGSHKGHKASLLADLTDHHRRLLRNQLNKLKTRSNALHKLSNQIASNSKTLAQNHSAVEQQTKKHFMMLFEQLKKRQAVILRQLRQRKTPKDQALLKQRQDIAVAISKLTAICQEASVILSRTDNISFMSKVSNQIQRMDAVLQESRKFPENTVVDINIAISFDDQFLKELSMHGVFGPSPPRLLSCKATGLAAALTWEKPSPDNTFSSYCIETRHSDADSKENEWRQIKTCDGGTFTDSVGELAPATRYECRLKGQNKNVWSGCSNVMKFMTASVPKVTRHIVSVSPRGIQRWTVPRKGKYEIEAFGAQGGCAKEPGGKGARIKGRITLGNGDVLYILVGQKGVDSQNATGGGQSAGGGGGTYVAKGMDQPLIIAGGGGGAGSSAGASPSEACGGHGVVAENGDNGKGSHGAKGGTAGSGGEHDVSSGGCSSGAGFSGDSYDYNSSSYATKATCFKNGGMGSTQRSTGTHGGFGGGGGGCWGGGGGGGYSGGGCGNHQPKNAYGGGGGGSFSSGSDTSSTSSVNTGHGKVRIISVDGIVDLTFTNCGQSGKDGPTQKQCDLEYK